MNQFHAAFIRGFIWGAVAAILATALTCCASPRPTDEEWRQQNPGGHYHPPWVEHPTPHGPPVARPAAWGDYDPTQLDVYHEGRTRQPWVR